MRYLTILLLYLYFNPTRGVESSIRNYLADRMRYVNEEFARIKRSPKDDHKHSQIDFGESHLVTFENTTEAHTFDLFGRNYLLSDGELYYVALEDNKYILTSLQTFPEMRDEIAFIKTTDHNGIGFMFVSFVHDTVSHVYRFRNDSLEPRMPIQMIKTINKLTDATFFVSHGSLYLAISSVLGVSMAPVVVYKWEESHFDVIEKIYVDGAIGLSTFPNFDSDSEIFIVLRNNELESSNSYVYEFDADKLSKIQILDDVMSTRHTTFNHENNTFLVVFNDAPTSTLYRWVHNEFILLHQFEVQPNVQQVFLSVQDDTPLIATATTDNMMVFTLVTDSMQHLNTYNLTPNFAKILNMHIAEFFEQKVVLLLGLTENHELNFMLVPMTLSKLDIVSSTHQSDNLADCMDQLESFLNNDFDVDDDNNEVPIPSSSQTHEKIVQMSNPVEMDVEEFNAKAEAAVRQNIPEETFQSDELQSDVLRVLNHLKNLEEKSQLLTPRLNQALSNNDVIVNGKVLIQGALDAEKLTATSIRTKKLNGLNWEPESWLSTSGNQIITTPLYVRNLKISDLEVHNDNGLFKDTLSTASVPDGNQTLFGVMRVGSLKAFNIFAPQINDVDMRSLYLRRAPARITGNKSFNNVNAADVHATTLNGKNTSEAIKLFGDPKALQYEFQALVTVKNLEVETINDVDWRNFSTSVFRIGGEQTIHGDVTLRNVKMHFLSPELIGGVRVEDLLTTSTTQTVDSIVHFRSVNAPNVRAKRINGLDFANDVATVGTGENTLISGPVTLKTMHITGNLAINGSVDEFYKQNHIVGTHERDLLQIYNNKVRINGDLHLASVDVAQAARLFINGNEFNQASFDDYWLKTTNQEIPVHFEAQRGITTPHLNTKLLNDIAIDDYMVNDGAVTKGTTYVFENVTIIGNVIVDRAKHHQPDLQKLNAEAVKLNGTYAVRGSKKFVGRISAENLKADQLNAIKTSELLTQSASNIIGSKSIRNLTVQSVNVNNLTMQQLNGIDLQELRSRAVFINQPAEIANVDFDNLTANHLFTKKINNKLFNEYLVELNQLHLLEALNKLEIIGNASISKVERVIYINNVNMPAIIEKIGEDAESEPVVNNLFIDGKVHVKELFVGHLNDINLQELMNLLYYRVWPQNVTARHTFKYLLTENVYTPQINNIQTTNLINVNSKKPQVIEIKHGLTLNSPRFKRSLFANITACDVQAAIGDIHEIPKRAWRSVVIDNLTLSDPECSLARLLNNAVNTKKDNIILAPTSLNHVYADAVFNRKQINGIDLHRIVSDALTYNATDQVVTGMKEFVKLTAAAMGVEGSTLIPNVNGIDVVKLDQSILTAANLNGVTIQGKKTFFGGVQTDRLSTPVASGVMPENLVSMESLRSVPRVTFDDLTVLNQLNIGMVNNVNFSRFLEDRLLLDAGYEQITTANYYFDALQLNGVTTIPRINDIQLEDVVFDEGLQVISVPKKFVQNIEVQGDAIIEILNGLSFSDFYQHSILLQEEAHITGDINLLAPSQITGDIRAKSINGIPFEHILELLRSENHRVRIEIINDALRQIEGLVSQNTEVIRRLPHQYLYLERSDDIQVQLEHAHDAQIIEKKDGVLMHIHTSESGEHCGLADECECPSQQTIKIQPSKSHSFLENKYEERIYSYEDRDIIVDVVTNTKSRSKLCSSNSSQEFTTINWYTFTGTESNAKTPGKKYSFPEHITGYISDVKFFSLDGHVYVILATLYDHGHDTAELNSLVLRISQDKTQIDHVQKLKTNGAKTVHVFHTAQGVNLVIGNVGSGLFYETLTTDIYSFDRETKMFKLLRMVPTTGCTSATSVVLGVDSLIILAQKNSPLQVLQYNPFYQTYYFHEAFLHDVPVSSVSVFYTGGFGTSDAYLTAVTEKGHFYIYSYHYLIGWRLESDGQMDGLTSLVPLEIGDKQYLFAPSSKTTSSLLTVVKQGV